MLMIFLWIPSSDLDLMYIKLFPFLTKRILEIGQRIKELSLNVLKKIFQRIKKILPF